MYAVIRTGGKQYRVEEGQRLDVERLGLDDGADLELAPVLVVDGSRVLATPGDLGSARVTARLVGAAKGPKIDGFTYKNKSNQRTRWGHRQKLSTIEITSIVAGGRKSTAKAATKDGAKGTAKGTAKGADDAAGDEG